MADSEETEVLAPVAGSEWDPVKQKLRKFGLLSFTVGDASGRKFTFEGPSSMVGRKMSRVGAGMSVGKFPAAVAIAGAVARGKLTFDTKVSDVFKWWDAGPQDSRSSVTLRHLMTFTSGFIEQGHAMDHSHNLMKVPCLDAGGSRWSLEDCAKQIYTAAPHLSAPGRIFDYNSYHLQVAMAMACAASGLSARELIQQNLLEPAGMTKTWWTGKDNPPVSFGILTTGDDLDSLARSYLAYKVLPKAVIDEMDKEYVQAHKCKVYDGMSVKWPRDQEFAMAHVSTRKARGPPETKLNRRVVWWYGAFGAGIYVDRHAGIYISLMMDTYKPLDPITVVTAEVYKALGKESPLQGAGPDIPDKASEHDSRPVAGAKPTANSSMRKASSAKGPGNHTQLKRASKGTGKG